MTEFELMLKAIPYLTEGGLAVVLFGCYFMVKKMIKSSADEISKTVAARFVLVDQNIQKTSDCVKSLKESMQKFGTAQEVMKNNMEHQEKEIDRLRVEDKEIYKRIESLPRQTEIRV